MQKAMYRIFSASAAASQYIPRVHGRDLIRKQSAAVSMVVIFSYAVIFYFSQQTKQYAEREHELQFLKVQLASYYQQSEMLFEGERRLTTLRHDIDTITSLLQEGCTEQVKVCAQSDM